MSILFNNIYKNQNIIKEFVSPSNLTSNGTLGGDSFAVKSGFFRHPSDGGNGEYEEWDDTETYPAWYAFDSSNSTFCLIPAYPEYLGYLYIYNPDPINIESMVITMRSSTYGIRSFTLQYSDDGETWYAIEYFNAGNTSPSTWNITVTPYSGYHKYYRFEIDRGSRDSLSYRNVQMANIIITGTKLTE